MTDPLAFALAVLALLATPGPTNTLLATSGAAAGFRRSLHLVVAEICGYMFSITTLSLLIGPLVRASHTLGVALKVGCALFLFYAAWRLWREGAAAITSGKPVQFRRLLIATALNPKGVVFAFVIVPYLSHGQVNEALPYMGALAAMIALVGSAWIAIGATLRASASQKLDSGLVRRTGAIVLCVFAMLISGSAFTA